MSRVPETLVNDIMVVSDLRNRAVTSWDKERLKTLEHALRAELDEINRIDRALHMLRSSQPTTNPARIRKKLRKKSKKDVPAHPVGTEKDNASEGGASDHGTTAGSPLRIGVDAILPVQERSVVSSADQRN